MNDPDWIAEYKDYAEAENAKRQEKAISRTIYPSAWGDALPFLPDNDYFRKSCLTFVRVALASVKKRGFA